MDKTEPHFIVERGTNIRIMIGDSYTPEVYDTQKLAQGEIDRRKKFNPSLDYVPITVAEFQEKYGQFEHTIVPYPQKISSSR